MKSSPASDPANSLDANRKLTVVRTARSAEGGASNTEGVASLALSQPEFNRLVSDHGPVLYRVAYRMVGDDAGDD